MDVGNAADCCERRALFVDDNGTVLDVDDEDDDASGGDDEPATLVDTARDLSF